MTNLQQLVKDTQKQLDTLKRSVIGIFKIYSTNHFVLEYDKDSDIIYCLSITTQGAISELYVPSTYGVFTLLPEGYDSLYHLLQDPTVYAEWIKTI